MERKLRRILRETIEEFIDNVSIDNLKSDTHGLPIVYQCAFSDRLPNIFKNGFSREYAGTAGGNYYCTGLYTTFNLRSTIENSKTKSSLYGDAIIKMGIKSYDHFFIANKRIAQEVYGAHWRYEDQLEMLFKGHERLLEKIKHGPFWNTITQTYSRITSQNVVALLQSLDGMNCKSDGILSQLGIMGFVFTGNNDGDVSIIRDFKAIIPLAYSVDHGKTWKNDLLSDTTLENTANDYDPIIFLGKDANKYVNPKNYRMINGYMRVRRKADGKYNFIDENTHEVLSPIWFDMASNMSSNQRALVKYNSNDFYVGEDGYYESEDDVFPFSTFDEI